MARRLLFRRHMALLAGIVGCVAGLGLLGAPADTLSARTSYSAPASCGTYADGSGYCYGSLRGFGVSAEGAGNAFLERSTVGGAYFGATFNGNYFGCSVPGTRAELDAAAAVVVAGGADAYFNIYWNAKGQCTQVTAFNLPYLGLALELPAQPERLDKIVMASSSTSGLRQPAVGVVPVAALAPTTSPVTGTAAASPLVLR